MDDVDSPFRLAARSVSYESPCTSWASPDREGGDTQLAPARPMTPMAQLEFNMIARTFEPIAWLSVALVSSAVALAGSPESRTELDHAAKDTGRVRLGPHTALTAVATLPKPTARERLAADELRTYLAQMSNLRLESIEVTADAVPAGSIAIGRLAEAAGLVSRAELDAVAPDGYVVKAAGNQVAICGDRDLGTVYGVYALLRRLGVRFYAEGCEVVPRSPDLVIPSCVLRARPFYEFRKLDPFPKGRKMPYDPVGSFYNLKLGCTPVDDIGSPRDIGEPNADSLIHTAAYLVPFGTYGKAHPEYFALKKKGEGSQWNANQHLCLSNAGTRAVAAERLLMLMDKQKERKFFFVGQGDGHSSCECPACEAFGSETDRLMDFVNVIARQAAGQYPDKRVMTLAYTDGSSPPVNVLPEPNVLVLYCPYPPHAMCQSHDLSCEKNAQARQQLQGWLARCPNNMGIFDYARGYAAPYEPFGSFYAMKRKLDFYVASGVRGLFYCGVPTNFRDLFVFVQSRLLWEPKTDVEPLIDEFMAAYYGKAARHIRDYFDFLHKQIETLPVHQMCERANPSLVNVEFAKTGFEMFRKAEEAAVGDPTVLGRVSREKFCLLFADLNVRNPAAGNLAESEAVFARRLAEFIAIGRTVGITIVARSQGDVGDWLARVVGIRTTAEPWYTDPIVDALIADPVEVLHKAPVPR